MSDLISRDAVLKILNNSRSIRARCGGVSGIWINLLNVVGEIERVPAVEAKPVRHAWWKAANRRGTLCDTYICSECGNMVMQTEGYTYSCTCNYCPGCGAKMDSDEKNV